MHVRLPTTSMAQFQTAHGPVVGWGLGPGDPCSKEQSRLISFVQKYLAASLCILLHILDFCIQKNTCKMNFPPYLAVLFVNQSLNAHIKQRSVALGERI